MKTYSRSVWDDAQRSWAEGDYGPEWREVRHQAAMRGILYPPSGSRWDGWDADEPSQRALVYRAIVDTPAALRVAISRSSSWSQVLGRLLDERDDAAQDAAWQERRERDEPTHIESAQALKAIIERMANS